MAHRLWQHEMRNYGSNLEEVALFYLLSYLFYDVYQNEFYYEYYYVCYYEYCVFYNNNSWLFICIVIMMFRGGFEHMRGWGEVDDNGVEVQVDEILASKMLDGFFLLHTKITDVSTRSSKWQNCYIFFVPMWPSEGFNKYVDCTVGSVWSLNELSSRKSCPQSKMLDHIL